MTKTATEIRLTICGRRGATDMTGFRWPSIFSCGPSCRPWGFMPQWSGAVSSLLRWL